MSLFTILLPEICLVSTACVLFLLAFAGRRGTGRVAATIGLVGVLAALVVAVSQYRSEAFHGPTIVSDVYTNFRVTNFGLFIRVIALATAALLLLLSWPSGERAEGNDGVHYGKDAGEYFGLLLLAFTGLILVPSANDLMVLFLAIELASIPTYILVAISRPIAVAQEAGVKYFFLGAMSAAIMLMGFGYLYGVSGSTNLREISQILAGVASPDSGAPVLSAWHLLAGVLIVVGIGFKLAAVPLHAYVADVYQGSATAVTAVLGFVPKATGILALTKLLFVFTGGDGAWNLSPQLGKLIFAIAILTMTVGNLLALVQSNVKRILAYSSVAHSGYLLAGLAIVLLGPIEQRGAALTGVIFYLATYGITSTAAFGALMLIPTRQTLELKGKEYFPPATTAETMDDLAGVGRSQPLIGLLLAVACFSLMGLPLTAGFFGKFYLLAPAIAGFDRSMPNSGWIITLAIFVLVNSAISAAYYLGIVGALFNRKDVGYAAAPRRTPLPVNLAVGVCVGLVLGIGLLPSTTRTLVNASADASSELDLADRPAR